MASERALSSSPFTALVAVDELDDGNGRGIAVAIAGLQHARVAAGAVLVARRQRVEELLDHGLVAHARGGEPARVEVAALGQRDVLVDHALQVLGLGQRGDDLLVPDEATPPCWRTWPGGGRCRGRTAGPASCVACAFPLRCWQRGSVASRCFGSRQTGSCDALTAYCPLPTASINTGPRSAWPDPRCCRAASSALPCRGAGPCWPAPP